MDGEGTDRGEEGEGLTMLTFLFWNLNGKPLEASVARLVQRHAVDVLILAECTSSAATILTELSKKNAGNFEWTSSRQTLTHVFSRFGGADLSAVEDGDDRMSVWKLMVPENDEVLLVVVHLVSKLHWSDDSQSQQAPVIARRIRGIEEKRGHARTILVGDFNMNPFEAGMVSANGFNATMSRRIAFRGRRTILGESCDFFYNPMWSHFGDLHGSPPGTYYYDRSEPVTYFWNIFDQVLLRPSLLDCFGSHNLKILENDGAASFLTRSGRPGKSVGSDHLPIVFSLDFNMDERNVTAD